MPSLLWPPASGNREVAFPVLVVTAGLKEHPSDLSLGTSDILLGQFCVLIMGSHKPEQISAGV